MVFKNPIFHFFKTIIIILILVSSVSTVAEPLPFFVQLRKEWKHKNRDDIIKDVEIDCRWNFLYDRPLCSLSEETLQDLVNTIYDNECLDLHNPDDDAFL